MTANLTNQVAYLRTSREFPEDLRIMAIELTKAYIDIANVVNSRVIGTFSTNRPAINGKSFFITNARHQGLRQVYTFSSTGNIAHGLNNTYSAIPYFTQSYGSFTDGTNWYGAIYGSNVAIAGQVSFYVTPTNIVVLAGAGAPTITSGIIVLEWISNV